MHGLGTIIALNNRAQREADRKRRAAARLQARLNRLEAENRNLKRAIKAKGLAYAPGTEDSPERYEVNTAPGRNRYFSTVEAAREFANDVFKRTNVVLSIVRVK